MKPICVQCERFMRMKKSGYAFVEGMPKPQLQLYRAELPIGKGSDECWQPYKLWFGDLWECPTCHSQTVVGVAQQPFREHHMKDFKEKVEAYNAMKLFVKDC